MSINVDFFSAQPNTPLANTSLQIPSISDKVWDVVLAQVQSGPGAILPLVLVEPDVETDTVTLAALQAIAHGEKPLSSE